MNLSFFFIFVAIRSVAHKTIRQESSASGLLLLRVIGAKADEMEIICADQERCSSINFSAEIHAKPCSGNFFLCVYVIIKISECNAGHSALK